MLFFCVVFQKTDHSDTLLMAKFNDRNDHFEQTGIKMVTEDEFKSNPIRHRG